MRRSRGFTFIEIGVVLIIIFVLMAVSLPRMKGMMGGLRLKQAARDVTALMRYARNVAVLRENPCQVCFDVEKDTYELTLLDAGGEPVKEKRTSRHSRKAQEDRFSVGDDVAGTRQLPQNVHFNAIYTAAPLNGEKLPCINFFPDGSATAATIAIQDDKEEAISVEIYQTTGMARVEKGLPPEQDDKAKSRIRFYGPKK